MHIRNLLTGLLLVTAARAFSQDGPAPTVPTEYAFTIEAAISAALPMGPSADGERRSIPITGGTFSGEGINGEVVPGGADYQVTRADGKPSLIITSPADNAFFGSSAGATFTVSGTFDSATVATVEVNGENATLNGSTFTADVPFSSLLNTHVVARVTASA